MRSACRGFCSGRALLLWSIGDLYYLFFLSGLDEVSIPSLSDPFYLAFYPVSYVALGLLLRARMKRFRGNLWLDGADRVPRGRRSGRGCDLRRGDQHDGR